MKESVRGRGVTQVAHRIDRSAIDADFIVDVRAGGASTHANIANRIAASSCSPTRTLKLERWPYQVVTPSP